MNHLMSRLWNDDAGYILSFESVFLVTITVLGLITGWVAVRNSVVSELTEVGNAIGALSQCYSFSGLSNCNAQTCGSAATDSYTTIALAAIAPVSVTIDQNRCP